MCDQQIEIIITDKLKQEVVLYKNTDTFHYINLDTIKSEQQQSGNTLIGEIYSNDDCDIIGKYDFNQVKKYISQSE